jgi:hypothetical protein
MNSLEAFDQITEKDLFPYNRTLEWQKIVLTAPSDNFKSHSSINRYWHCLYSPLLLFDWFARTFFGPCTFPRHESSNPTRRNGLSYGLPRICTEEVSTSWAPVSGIPSKRIRLNITHHDASARWKLCNVSEFYLQSFAENSEWFYMISTWLLTSGLGQVFKTDSTLSCLLGMIVVKDSLL